MGCDIHLFVEVRPAAEGHRFWKKVDRCVRLLDKWDYTVTERQLRFDEGRNYDMFAQMADVRNGTGFAGVDMGDGFIPILSFLEAADAYRAQEKAKKEEAKKEKVATVALPSATATADPAEVEIPEDPAEFEALVKERMGIEDPPDKTYGQILTETIAADAEQAVAMLKFAAGRWNNAARGIPEDCADEIEEEHRRWGSDAHTASWITLGELLRAEQEGYFDLTTKRRGVVSKAQAQHFRETGQPPDMWAGAVWGMGAEDHEQIEWPVTYAESGRIQKTLIPRMRELTDYWVFGRNVRVKDGETIKFTNDDVRTVFWFDN